VVVAGGLVRSLRFDAELRGAGEDRMFWLELALAGARIAISWRCNVTCGTGVNLFFSAHDWNSAATLEKFASQLLFAEKLKRQKDSCRRRRWISRGGACGIAGAPMRSCSSARS
jgi:succinoglycan biosynthesis protein ExoW